MNGILLLLFAFSFGGNALSRGSVIQLRESLIEPRSIRFNLFEDESDTRKIKPRASCICGVKTLSKIVGGHYATMNEYPWMAAICYKSPCSSKSQFCGGSLINNQYILTAAHCTQNFTAATITISLGDHNLAITSETDSKEYQAQKIIMHRDYNSTTLKNDIALIKLNTKVQMTDNISPICLPPQGLSYEGKTAYISGWGHTSQGGNSSQILKEVPLKVISHEECASAYAVGEITTKMLCATKKGSDSCQGDSGGPLVYKDSNGYYEQIGIVSWGEGCADSRYPGVYIKVNDYLTWIKGNSKLATFCTDESPK